MSHTATGSRSAAPRQSASSTTRSALIITGSIKEEPRSTVRLENTYKMEPTSHFPDDTTEAIIKEVLERAFDGRKYAATECNDQCRDLANQIKARVKAMNPPRYKVVTFVVVGEENLGTVNLASRCVWNAKFDTYSEYSYRNGSIYAVGMVYGIYAE